MTDRIRITADNVARLMDEVESGFWEEWQPARSISDTFHIARTQVTEWGKAGMIRRRGTGKFYGVRELHEYNLLDVMRERTRRRHLTQRQIEERPDGLYVSCVDCPGLHHRSSFYANNSALGVSTRCKPCHNARGKAWDRANIDKRNAKKQRASRKSAAAARAAQAWEPPRLYPAAPVVEVVTQRYGDTPVAEIERLAGLPEDGYRSIVRAAGKGTEVRVSSIDRLLEGLDLIDEMARIAVELEKDRPAWHPTHPYCVSCYRVSVPHHARGLCRTCHRRKNVPGWKPPVESDWSIRHPHCVTCGGTDSPHHGHGQCDRCLQRERGRKLRAAEKVGSGHGNDGSIQEQVEAADGGSSGQHDRGRLSSNA